MNPRKVDKTPLAGDPDRARAQLEQLSGALSAENKAAGERLQAVAVELIRLGLQVALIDYHDAWWELEAILPQAPHLGPVTVDRDAAGTSCQLTWEHRADITAQDGPRQVADAAAALLRGLAGCPPLTGPRSPTT
jgi:hypothetical protein